MRIAEVKLYQYDELPTDAAKAKALDWMRESEAEFWEADFEAAETAAKLLGITFDTRPVKLMGGGTRYDSVIHYSGFGSQGDGASFRGRYEYARSSVAKVASEFPTDTTLNRIARELAYLQKTRGYRISAKITQDGRYSHSNTMHIEAYDRISGNEIEEDTETSDELLQLMRAFADWIYDGLREDYMWRLEDEQLIDTLTANEYEFREDGRRACE
jgi:hypothetical protein